jgi:hypothetical protein
VEEPAVSLKIAYRANRHGARGAVGVCPRGMAARKAWYPTKKGLDALNGFSQNLSYIYVADSTRFDGGVGALQGALVISGSREGSTHPSSGTSDLRPFKYHNCLIRFQEPRSENRTDGRRGSYRFLMENISAIGILVFRKCNWFCRLRV